MQKGIDNLRKKLIGRLSRNNFFVKEYLFAVLLRPSDLREGYAALFGKSKRRRSRFPLFEGDLDGCAVELFGRVGLRSLKLGMKKDQASGSIVEAKRCFKVERSKCLFPLFRDIGQFFQKRYGRQLFRTDLHE